MSGGCLGRALLVVSALCSPALAQDRISNARTERHQVTQPLEPEIQAIAAGGDAAWIGYRLAVVPFARQLCSAPVQLEPAKEIIVLVRVAGGTVDRLRTFTPNCEIDAGDLPMTWLDGVTPDASAAWLTSIVRSVPANGARDSSLMQPALSALELNPGPVALTTLVGFARDDTRPNVRSRALTALAQRAGQEASATIQNAINNDPDTAVKKTAVGALARMPKDEGIPLLIQVARTNKNVDVRKQAMFWLGESKDPRAVTFFEEILKQ